MQEIFQAKYLRNILWISIVAAQESGTHPLDFTETTQRHEQTSASANLNRGVSKGGFSHLMTCVVNWPMNTVTICNLWWIGKKGDYVRKARKARVRKSVHLYHSLWMNEWIKWMQWWLLLQFVPPAHRIYFTIISKRHKLYFLLKRGRNTTKLKA